MGIKKHIPNCITSLNLASGTLGVVMAAQGYIPAAFILMLAGAVFDFCDGLSARALGAYSPMGKELDSLADVITFGLLPALMLHRLMASFLGTACIFVWVPLAIAVFSGIRLAKFNIDERQTSSFIGLPTPACAILCGALATYVAMFPASRVSAFALGEWPIPVMSAVLCFLLVCEIPMFSMKIHKGEGICRAAILRIIFGATALICLLAVIIAGKHWTAAVVMAFTAYIIINLAAAAFAPKKKQE